MEHANGIFDCQMPPVVAEAAKARAGMDGRMRKKNDAAFAKQHPEDSGKPKVGLL